MVAGTGGDVRQQARAFGHGLLLLLLVAVVHLHGDIIVELRAMRRECAGIGRGGKVPHIWRVSLEEPGAVPERGQMETVQHYCPPSPQPLTPTCPSSSRTLVHTGCSGSMAGGEAHHWRGGGGRGVLDKWLQVWSSLTP